MTQMKQMKRMTQKIQKIQKKTPLQGRVWHLSMLWIFLLSSLVACGASSREEDILQEVTDRIASRDLEFLIDFMQDEAKQEALENHPSKNTILHLASAQGDLDLVKWILQVSPLLLDAKNARGETPIFLAIENGYLDLVKYFVQKKANLELINVEGKKPIRVAQEEQKEEIVQYLLSIGQRMSNITSIFLTHQVQGIPVLPLKDFQDEEKMLIQAIQNQEDDQIVKEYLLDYEPELGVVSVDETGRNIVHYIVQYGQLSYLKILEQHWKRDAQEANYFLTLLEYPDKMNWRPIHIAVQLHRKDFISYFDKKRMIFVPHKKTEISLLSLAIQQQDTELISFLLQKGYSFQMRDADGNTPLLFAIEQNLPEMASYLISLGAPVNTFHLTSKDTPLGRAWSRGMISVVEDLLRKGADPSLANQNGFSFQKEITQDTQNRYGLNLLWKEYVESFSLENHPPIPKEKIFEKDISSFFQNQATEEETDLWADSSDSYDTSETASAANNVGSQSSESRIDEQTPDEGHPDEGQNLDQQTLGGETSGESELSESNVSVSDMWNASSDASEENAALENSLTIEDVPESELLSEEEGRVTLSEENREISNHETQNENTNANGENSFIHEEKKEENALPITGEIEINQQEELALTQNRELEKQNDFAPTNE